MMILQTSPGWSELLQYGPTVVILALILAFLIRMAPIWKEVKLREMDVRESEISLREKIAASVGRLADVLREIAIEQRQASEAIQVAQRVNVNSNEKLGHTVDDLAHSVDGLNDRMDKVEQLADAVAAVKQGVK